jgi:hypothetical protein
MTHQYERRRLNPELVRAVRDAITPRGTQALLAGFPQATHLSHLLHTRRRIVLTPLTRQRFQRLAANVGFTGDLFLEEPEVEA